MRYPIYLHQADDGSFSGFVPDVIGCYFAGDTIDDAIQNCC
ncbi:type II toxin-antitoxin system HicB family antitoxin [Photorhabdus australis]